MESHALVTRIEIPTADGIADGIAEAFLARPDASPDDTDLFGVLFYMDAFGLRPQTLGFTHRPACHNPRFGPAQPPPRSAIEVASFITRPPDIRAAEQRADRERKVRHTMTDTTDDRKKVADLIKDFRFAMLTTPNPEGKLTAHPLTVQEAEFDGDLWFLVSKTSAPLPNPTGVTPANVSMSSDDSWVSLSGIARLVGDREKIHELWNPVVEAWFPNGPDDPDVGLLLFSADSAQYWDTPGGKIAIVFSFVKSKITGERYDGGDSGKVDL